MKLYRRFVSSFRKYFVASPASKMGRAVSPETLATTKTNPEVETLATTETDPEVEPGSESSSTTENPFSDGPISLQSNSTTTSSLPETSTGTAGPAAPVSLSVTEQATSNASTARPPAQDSLHARPGEDMDIGCVFFGSNSYVGLPTFNIDSEDATGATYNTPEDRFWPQRPPSSVAYPPQITHPIMHERVMYFGPGTVVGSPTVNVRSPRASGTTFR